ncbi:MAG TPA: SCO1664 family protein [Nocardioidaceae bacterium]|nr:SCO1664 family protein [Nocardioidaceae bacterium]
MRLLREGTLELRGRIMPASNATFLADATLGDETVACVYKPVSGERPLWDFPDGTLANREVAAYAVSEALGWDLVPFTLLREGPAGPGMVQLWREPDPAQEPVDVVRRGAAPAGYCRVLDAYDGQDRPVSLVHEDSAELRRMAVFDAVVNNADRKGGHVLAMSDGHRYAVDHGVCFNVDPKLRTVLWGWADQPLLADHADAVEKLLAHEGLHTTLSGLLDAQEVRAFDTRCRQLLRRGRMPVPSGDWPAIPWPAF